MMICTIGQRHQQSIANIAMPELKNVNAINTMIAIAGGMKNMNNLYERLKPEVFAKLQEQGEEYPFAVASFMEEFRNANFVMDLKYGTAVSLSNFLRLKNYDFVSISNLFES